MNGLRDARWLRDACWPVLPVIGVRARHSAWRKSRSRGVSPCGCVGGSRWRIRCARRRRARWRRSVGRIPNALRRIGRLRGEGRCPRSSCWRGRRCAGGLRRLRLRRGCYCYRLRIIRRRDGRLLAGQGRARTRLRWRCGWHVCREDLGRRVGGRCFHGDTRDGRLARGAPFVRIGQRFPTRRCIRRGGRRGARAGVRYVRPLSTSTRWKVPSGGIAHLFTLVSTFILAG